MKLVSADVDVGQYWASVGLVAGRILVVVIIGAVTVRVARTLINRVDDRRFREQLLYFVPKLALVIVLILALAAVGIDVSGFAAVMATVGFTGAVVFTPIGQNFVAGAMIRLDHIYVVGDIVTVGDLHGKVVYRSLLRTELELPDGSTAWIPNSTFQDNEVLNHSRMGGWRICVQVPLDCAADRSRAQRVMDEVMASLPWNCPDRTAFIAFDRVGGEAMFFNAYAWIHDRTMEPWFRGLLLSDLVDALEAAGVSVGQTTNLSIGATRRAAEASDELRRGLGH